MLQITNNKALKTWKVYYESWYQWLHGIVESGLWSPVFQWNDS